MQVEKIKAWNEYGDEFRDNWNNQFKSIWIKSWFNWFNLTHLGEMGSIDQIGFDYSFNHVWLRSWEFGLN